MAKHIKPTSNINIITCGYETCISTMLLNSGLNKWQLTQLAKLDKLYINAASTRPLQIYHIYYIYYDNQTFPNNSHIHLKSFDYASSYHFPFSISGSKITKWDYIFNYCAECPGMNAADLESSKQIGRLFFG